MLVTIIGSFLTIFFIFVLFLSLNILNEHKRHKDLIFDKYLTKNNIKTRFDENL